MFSARVPGDAPENQLTLALRALRAQGAALLDLSESNPTRARLLPDEDLQDLLQPLASPAALRYEPDPRGLPCAREAIAGYYQRRGVAVDPDRLILSASTSEAYGWLFQLLCDPGDAVHVPVPSYPLFAQLAALSAVNLSPYPAHYVQGRWCLDLHALARSLTPRSRALLLVSPNNPTGAFLHQPERAALLDLAQRHGLALIADEVFGDYPLDAPADAVPTLCTEQPVLTFVLSGLSKVLGLPQLKLGWIHLGGPAPLREAAQRRLELIADTFLSVSTPVQQAAPALLLQQPRLQGAILQRVRRNHQALRERLRGSAAQPLVTEGGWCAVLRLPRVLSEEEWALRLLKEEQVLCHPGFFYDFADEAYLVVSLLPEPAVVAAGVARVLALVERVIRT